MEMNGQQVVPLTQEQTWHALNDTEVLKECIPGCEEIEQLSDSQYQLTMTARIGPVKARFKGVMTLSDMEPPRAYIMSFEGQGGVAGFAKGRATVALEPQGNATRIGYSVKAAVGGKLAQLGARLIDGVARKLAEQFFSSFNAHVAAQGVPNA